SAATRRLIEFWGAVEDSAGSDTYGTATLLGTVEPTPANGWGIPVRFLFQPALDGRKRLLTARHVHPGYTPSAFTSDVIVDPSGDDETPTGPVEGAVVLGEADTNYPNGEVLTAGDGMEVARTTNTITVGIKDGEVG